MLYYFELFQWIISMLISSAAFTGSDGAPDISVLLTNMQGGYYHNQVDICSDREFYMEIDGESKEFKAGDEISFKQSDFKNGTEVKLKMDNSGGKFEILTIKKANGPGKYRGSIIIKQTEQGLVVINTLPLEEYLYGVVPSEIPAGYGLEPARVMAICARSYAIRAMGVSNGSLWGADVDDTTSYQVYGSMEENEISTQGVDDTCGLVLKCGEEVVQTFYYSTSCGSSADGKDVWLGSGADGSYVYEGRLLNLKSEACDLSNETDFIQFLDGKSLPGFFESEQPWFRWETFISLNDIQNALLTKKCTTGKIKEISVTERGESGIAKELTIQGSEGNAVVVDQYKIRSILTPANSTIVRQDGSEIYGSSLLPSAFFYLKPSWSEGTINGYMVYGGGYGHGTGISQNCVYGMAESGMNYEEIIDFFYKDCSLEKLYE